MLAFSGEKRLRGALGDHGGAFAPIFAAPFGLPAKGADRRAA